MPAIANIVVNDRAGTPVTHTYVPRDITNGVANYLEQGSSPLADKRMSLSLSRTKDNGRYKVVYKLAIPTVQTQTVNGINSDVLVRTAYVNVEMTFDPTSTVQERKDIVGQVANGLSQGITQVSDTYTNLLAIY